MTNARSGPARILDCGMVTTFMAWPLTLTVPLTDGSLYTVELRFAHDPTVEDVRVAVRQEGWGMVLTLHNFDRADGRGSAVPVFLGESGGEVYYLHFRVFRFGRTDDHTVHYTFYVASAGEVTRGGTPAT